VEDLNDLAKNINCEAADLSELLEILDRNEQELYRTFYISKKSGGFREISAPSPKLKEIQKQIKLFIEKFYKPNKAANGFLYNRNILTNSIKHCKKRQVLNLDLKNFFPSIHLKRVWGMFYNSPFDFNDYISKILTKLCCFENRLPQGAPTSPIITNIICYRLDLRLIDVSKRNFCYYTRYADDLTFSTTKYCFPTKMENEITSIINQEGFEINKDKRRVQNYWRRQEVTGLTVNKKPNVKRKYVRTIRAVLHNWLKNGLEEAAHYYSPYGPYYLKRSIKGKIDFVGLIRGKDDEIHKKLLSEYKLLSNTVTVNV